MSRYYGEICKNNTLKLNEIEYENNDNISTYNIPLDSSIHGNIWYANHNEQDFSKDHWKFDYKRWLNDKNEYINISDTATFGFGMFFDRCNNQLM